MKPCWEQWRLRRDNASVYTAIVTNIGNLLSKNWVAVLIHTAEALVSLKGLHQSLFCLQD